MPHKTYSCFRSLFSHIVQKQLYRMSGIMKKHIGAKEIESSFERWGSGKDWHTGSGTGRILINKIENCITVLVLAIIKIQYLQW